MLPSDEFGFFYVALTIGNVLFSAGLIVNIFFTRYIVKVIQSAGSNAAYRAIRKVEKVVILAGFLLTTLIFFILSSISNIIGVQSRVVICLIVLDAYTSYIADLGRIYFQALGRTHILGFYTSIWMISRLALCTCAISLFHTVWAGILGQVMPSVIMYVCFRVWFVPSENTAPTAILALPSPVTLIVPTMGYTLLIVFSNLDVLVGYFLLSTSDLSIYTASSVFPKAILVVITPLLQMLFPMMMGVGKLSSNTKIVIGKIGLVTLILASIAVWTVWLLSEWLCGGVWGLMLCQKPTLLVILSSVVPLALLRLLVMLHFARGRDVLTLWLLVPIAFYPPYAWISEHTILGIAESYVWASTAALFIYLGVFLFSAQAYLSKSLKRN